MTDVAANLGAQRLAGERARHRRHDYQVWIEATDEWECRSCGVRVPVARRRAGTSARRLGHDQERRIERVYGPRKVGEFGDAIDLIGRDWKWQSKATRTAPLLWASRLDPWRGFGREGWVEVPITAMEPLRRDLRPLLIRSWVRQGVRPVDIIVVRTADWRELYGWAPASEYVAMTGAHFLETHGRDEP